MASFDVVDLLEHPAKVFSELVPGGAGKLRVVRQSDAEEGSGETPASAASTHGASHSMVRSQQSIGFWVLTTAYKWFSESYV